MLDGKLNSPLVCSVTESITEPQKQWI